MTIFSVHNKFSDMLESVEKVILGNIVVNTYFKSKHARPKIKPHEIALFKQGRKTNSGHCLPKAYVLYFA